MKMSTLSLSPTWVGERGRVRGYRPIFYISPLTSILSPQGERNIGETYFLGNYTILVHASNELKNSSPGDP
jgi:hypothetical protein